MATSDYLTEAQRAAMADAQAARTAAGETAAAESVAAADASAQAYGQGYNMGNNQNADSLYGPSATRVDQTQKERIAEQRSNFFYGGTATGQADALAAMRNNLQPYTDTLGGYGDAFYDQFQGAAARGAPQQGVQGVYGAADQLQGMVNNGPGPSLAQAQLEANSANAMRQQLAMAGSGRGMGGGASAFRQAAANQANIAGQANAATGMLQAQEAADFRNFQGNALAQAAGMYGQGAGIEMQQQAANDAYASNMGNFAMGAQGNAANIQSGVESGINSINTNAMSGGMAYEQALMDLYGIDRGMQRPGDAGINWLDVGLTTAGAVAGTFVSPGAGTVAGAGTGHAVGSNFG
jgi:hypothetical protein